MQVNEIIKYIRQPHLLNKASIPDLQKLVNDFPYFQSGHILLSLASKKWDDSIYQQSIKRTAIVVSNRARLYELINKEEYEAIVEEMQDSTGNPETSRENVVVGKMEDVIGKMENVVGKMEDVVGKIEDVVVIDEELKAKSEKLKADETKQETNDKLSDQHQETSNRKPETTHEKIDESSVELEIEKALVSSIVEKVVLKIDNQKIAQPASFTQWLEFLKKNEGAAEELVKKEDKVKTFEKIQQDQVKKTKQKQKDLIDKIIQSNPGPIRHKEEQKFFKSDQQAKESLLENEHLITETLAELYASQGIINKAVRSYEILSLKYPQKSAYFASLIQKLKDSQKK